MSLFTATRIRCRIFPGRVGINFVTEDTGSTPQLSKGAGCFFDLGFFGGDENDLLDVATIADITLMVKPLNSPASAPEILKTISANEINQTLTLQDWQDGNSQHASIKLLGSETQIAAGDHDLTIWGHTADNVIDTDVFGCSKLKVLDCGITTITNPSLSPNHPTIEQIAAMLSAYMPRKLSPGEVITLVSQNGTKLVKLGASDDGDFDVQTTPTT